MKIKSMYFVLCALFCIFLLLYSLKSVNLQLRVRIECEILRSFLTRCTAKTADMSWADAHSSYLFYLFNHFHHIVQNTQQSEAPI